MSVALSSSDRDVIERALPTAASSDVDDADDYRRDLSGAFELDRCATWVRDGKYRRVALQFPDGLLRYAPDVAAALEDRTGGLRMSILGDTSYGECCVDEVAAEHIAADAVVHFGRACLTPTERLPVLFVYTKLKLDVDVMKQKLRETDAERTFLFYDVRYHAAISERKEDLTSCGIVVCPPIEPDASNSNIRCGRLCPDSDFPKESDAVVYCGRSEDPYFTVLAMTFNRSRCFRYDVATSTLSVAEAETAARELKRRRFLVEKARDAARIGVLVGTLGASRYRHVVDQTLGVARKRGKKAYVFLVGKPNVPKLANFPEVDVFVLVACPENSVVTSRDFLKPVLTPRELDQALNPAREWSAEFSADFADILPGRPDHVAMPDDVEEAADVSLLTGRVRNLDVADKGDVNVGNGALATQEMRISALHSGGGGEFLSERTWQGLEQKLGQTEVTKAAEGRSGIAMGYEGEGS